MHALLQLGPVLRWGLPGPPAKGMGEVRHLGIAEMTGNFCHRGIRIAKKFAGPLMANPIEQLAEDGPLHPEPALQGADGHPDYFRRSVR